MASWRSHWGPELDQHFKNHVDASECEPTPEHPWGPEDWRARRQHSQSYTEDPEVPWEASREFDVMGRLAGISIRKVLEEVHVEWEIISLALYRQDEGLTMFDPYKEELLAFGMEPTPLPAFLEPFSG
jgi:hypothetical protein